MLGGLQGVLLFGDDKAAMSRFASDPRTRVMAIRRRDVQLENIWGFDLSSPPGAPATNLPMFQLALMVFGCIAGWQIANEVGLFSTSNLGPIIFVGLLTPTLTLLIGRSEPQLRCEVPKVSQPELLRRLRSGHFRLHRVVLRLGVLQRFLCTLHQKPRNDRARY